MPMPASVLVRKNDLKSGGISTELTLPHHFWYIRVGERLLTWELTLSFELSSSVLKGVGSQ